MIVAALFGIGEMLTTSFFLAPFAVGAALAAVVDAAGAGAARSLRSCSSSVSLLTLAVLRPSRARTAGCRRRSGPAPRR